MITWLHQHRRALLQVLKTFFNQPIHFFLNTLVIGIALSLPLTGYLILEKAMEFSSSHFHTQNEINLYLTLETTEQDRKALETSLASKNGVKSWQFISKETALTELQKNDASNVLAGLESNPLPDAYRIILKETHPEENQALINHLKAQKTIEHIEANQDWALRLHAILEAGNQLLYTISILLAVALVVITGNTIRMQILSKQEEIEVSQLLGATSSFIRRPFLYHGALQGIIGGAMSIAIVDIVILNLQQTLLSLAQSYGSNFKIDTPDLITNLSILTLSGLSCWVGAWLAVNRQQT